MCGSARGLLRDEEDVGPGPVVGDQARVGLAEDLGGGGEAVVDQPRVANRARLVRAREAGVLEQPDPLAGGEEAELLVRLGVPGVHVVLLREELVQRAAGELDVAINIKKHVYSFEHKMMKQSVA